MPTESRLPCPEALDTILRYIYLKTCYKTYREIVMHHRIHHFFGRHSRTPRFRLTFARGFMEGGGMGGRGFGMGRKLGSADLQLLILRLLDEKPSHGYEIIKALDEHSNGFYVPSPGMVYPALTYLEELGFATVEAWARASNTTSAPQARSTWRRTAPRPMRCSHNSAASASAWIACAARWTRRMPARNPAPTTNAAAQRNCIGPGVISSSRCSTNGAAPARNNSASPRS